ncbi:MAG: hypothetical protein SFT81_02915 [Candidatus Caenarcaniphilales bacterium]|nr:hypothetical protein [Candidatus Caenarcaniphilales bacterium]
MIKRQIAGWYRAALNLLYDPQCPFNHLRHCEIPPADLRSVICSNCPELKIEPIKKYTDKNLPVHSACKYRSQAREINHEFKFHKPALAVPIAELMLTAIDLHRSFDLVIPVPGLISEVRPWIPSELLAEEIAFRLKCTYGKGLLVKSEQTHLYELGKESRQRTVNRAYRRLETNQLWKKLDQQPHKILLIDDLIASGITLDTCAKLIQMGNPAHQITCLTFTASFYS